MKRLSIVLVAVLAACSAAGDHPPEMEFDVASKIKVGMSPLQVISIMGLPDGHAQDGQLLAYLYEDRILTVRDIYGGTDYQIVFIDGVLTEWGPNLWMGSSKQTGIVLDSY